MNQETKLSNKPWRKIAIFTTTIAIVSLALFLYVIIYPKPCPIPPHPIPLPQRYIIPYSLAADDVNRWKNYRGSLLTNLNPADSNKIPISFTVNFADLLLTMGVTELPEQFIGLENDYAHIHIGLDPNWKAHLFFMSAQDASIKYDSCGGISSAHFGKDFRLKDSIQYPCSDSMIKRYGGVEVVKSIFKGATKPIYEPIAIDLNAPCPPTCLER